MEAINITTQGDLHADQGLAQVMATASAIRQIAPAIEVEVIEIAMTAAGH